MQAVKFAGHSRSRTAMPLIVLPGSRTPGISTPYKNQLVQHLGALHDWPAAPAAGGEIPDNLCAALTRKLAGKGIIEQCIGTRAFQVRYMATQSAVSDT